MNMSRLLTAGMLLIVSALVVSAESAVGVISYLEGDVEVSRGGRYLSPGNIDIGLAIEPSDTIETGSNGYVEVELTAPAAGSLVKVRPGSAFYFETSTQSGSKIETLFQMLRGSLSLKVGKLSSRESYKVQTDSAVMAVRGTEFNVDMAADRSVLVTVPEGSVESKTDKRTVLAQPGTVAVVDDQAQISAMSIAPDDIDLYREYWQGLRLDALKINARLSIQQYSRQWDQQLPRMENAMRELASHDDIFRRWERVMQGDADVPPTGNAIRDKREVSPGMLELRAILPSAERTFNTLVGLEDAYRQGFAEGAFQAGNYNNARDFYRAFQSDKSDMKDMLARARWLVRIYRVMDSSASGFPDSNSSNIMSTPSF